MQNIASIISSELHILPKYVSAVLRLLEDGGTVPFIARYRKELHGSLDEVKIGKIKELAEKLEELGKRRDFILKTIEEQGKLTPDLHKKINAANNITQLEDLYLPYKPKRRTKATIAREKGLEPLAEQLFEQKYFRVKDVAATFINLENDVNNAEEALEGARDIIAEWISEDAVTRANLRKLFLERGTLFSKASKKKKEENEKDAAIYRDYFDWQEAVKKMPSHRIHAILRGNKEGFLRLKIEPEEKQAHWHIFQQHISVKNDASWQVKLASEDAYKRLLQPSLETETRNFLKEKADKAAIEVFSENLKEILLAPPLGEKRVMGIDPGFRTGCKVVCLDKFGKLLYNTTIYPHSGRPGQAQAIIENLVDDYKIEAIAIGNGTAGKETLNFIKSLKIADIQSVMISESGASIYSASEVAREEFPNLDLTVRGAISIGRRLLDPLAEMVKLDPKSIGVGQYQHDVHQESLKKSLDDVVMSSVNKVGVEVNTASKQLLTYVSGLGAQLAQNIVDYREENGGFSSKNELKKVKRLGAKAFEQAAGFIKIRNAKNALDSSSVHPESFKIVEKMAKNTNATVNDLIKNKDLRQQINLKNYVTETVGIPTLQDIMSELEKPGRDPRGTFEGVEFRSDINDISDLKEGMVLNGIITNVTNFGAFVDVGVHRDGLVHISQLANRFVKDPLAIVKVNQKVTVKVMDIDAERGRVNLSMKEV